MTNLDQEIAIQMEHMFARLIKSQTAVEPEFYEALYKNRSEMYTLFQTSLDPKLANE